MNIKECISNSPKHMANFLTYMQAVKGESSNTVLEYYFDLRTMFKFLIIKKNPDCNKDEIDISQVDDNFIKSITYMDILEFINYCTNDRKNQESARARKISAMNSFFNYLTNKIGLLSINPTENLETPRLKKKVMKYLTLEESINLLNAVEGKNKERDYCILTLFLNCGMRLSELVAININDIRPDNSLKLFGKGKKERTVYLNDACITAIQNYLAVRPNDKVKDKNALFISSHYNRISPKTVQSIVYKYLDMIGLGNQGYSVHKLRHTAATLMYQHGNVDVRVLQDILGHESLNTTQIYTHLSDNRIKSAVNANPLSKIKAKENDETNKNED